MPATVLLQQ